jgi:hypothetical protein
MKLKEQLEQLRTLEERYRTALQYTVIGRVQWSEPQMVARIDGMPRRQMRVGLMQASSPYVIVHEVDTHEVVVETPDQVAEWPWQTVDQFPGLDAFLRANATLGPVDVHVPGWAWIRKATTASAG